MKLTPFPRPFYKTYAVAAIATGLSIAFILTVFQPFGTSSFQHDYKYPILTGYGVVIAISVLAYYYLSLKWFNKAREEQWTIVHEVIDYLIGLAIAMTLTYVYYLTVFGHSFRWEGLLNFLRVASAVNTLPMLGLSAFMYFRYKDVVRSSLTLAADSPQGESTISLTLKGSNKSEIIQTTSASILYVQAEDNYVIIHLLNEQQELKKHMIRSTMKDLLNQLPDGHFIQCHRSYIVNMDRISGLIGNKNSSSLTINESQKKVPVGRSKYEELKTLASIN